MPLDVGSCRHVWDKVKSEIEDKFLMIYNFFQEGVIKSINPDTEEIEIELLKGLILPGKTNFSLSVYY